LILAGPYIANQKTQNNYYKIEVNDYWLEIFSLILAALPVKFLR